MREVVRCGDVVFVEESQFHDKLFVRHHDVPPEWTSLRLYATRVQSKLCAQANEDVLPRCNPLGDPLLFQRDR